MKFIADSMLGRLARWLRLLGYDTLYYRSIKDSLLLRIAREEDRILLTRDTRLIKTKGVKKFVLLSENEPFRQLKTVISTLQLDVKTAHRGDRKIYGRCSLCNALLEGIPKSDVRRLVPEYVYKTRNNFKQCPYCSKIYWEGTHQERLRKELKRILYN